MAYGVKLKVWGDYACFTRPEMKVERVSYDVMTPSAARGILEAIYWQHAIRWVIDRIHVMKPIRFANIRRNEVGCKLSERAIKSALNGGDPPSIFIEDERQQRAAMVLTNVEYVIDAHFEFTDARMITPAVISVFSPGERGMGNAFISRCWDAVNFLLILSWWKEVFRNQRSQENRNSG